MKPWRFLAFFLLAILVLAPLLLPPTLALAQTTVTGHTAGTGIAGSQGLVPCGAVSAGNAYAATECGLCDFGALIQRIINYLLILALPISAALFAYAGILLFTAGDNTENRSKAKSIFTHVLVGLLITFSGYLVVQTVVNVLVKGSQVFSGGFTFSFTQCADDPSGTGSRPRATSISQLFSQLGNVTVNTTGTPTTGTPGAVGGAGSVVGQYCTGTMCTNDQGNAAIATYDATAGNNQVVTKSNVDFTNVNPTLLGTIISQTATANGGTVTITSADDSGHAATSNHYTGNAVDIGYNNTAFNTYISSLQSVPNLIDSNAYAYKDGNGYIWTQEGANTPGSSGPHWHVSQSGR